MPVTNSVWFARMKDSFKVLSFTEANRNFTKKTMLSSGFAGFRTEPEHFAFLYNTIVSEDFHKLKDIYCTGATQMALTNGGMKQIKIALPPENLISKYSELTNSTIDNCIQLRKENQQLRAARDLLLPKLISGQLDVSELDIATEEMVTV